MQNKTKIQDKSLWRTIFRIAQWIIPIVVGIWLYRKFAIGTVFGDSLEILESIPVAWYLLLFFCSILNWGLETIKWQIMLKNLFPLKFGKALGSVLSGAAVAQLLPYRTGEYLGRLMLIPENKRIDAGLLSVASSYSQLLVTLLFGIAGFLIVKPFDYAAHFMVSLVLLTIIGLILYWYLPVLKLTNGNKYLLRLQSALRLATRQQLFKVLSVSFVRYCTFMVPYALLSMHFGVGKEQILTYHLAAVASIFFLQTVSPNFIATDIALRMAIPPLVYSGSINTSNETDFIPGMLIYLFNVVGPVIAGTVIIMFTKYKKA